MRYLVIIVGILVVIAWSSLRPFFADPFAGDREEDLAQMQMLADRANRGLPRQLDAFTKALRVDVTESGLVNQYQLNADRRDLLHVEMRRELEGQACSNRGYRLMMAEGFSITYRYVDPREIPLASFTFTEHDCPND